MSALTLPPASHNHTLRAFEGAHGLALTTSDLVAGLLYAQRIASIAKLTAGHVRDNGDQVQIMLGTAPVVLPDPLAGLVRELVATRRGHAAIGRPGTTPWLFPGGRPGQPIGDDRLGSAKPLDPAP